MESRETRDSDSNEPEQDTSHLSTKAAGRKKSSRKLVIALVLLVVVVAVAAGLYLYKIKVLDPQAAREQAALVKPSPSPTPKKLTPEEQMTKTLTDGVEKEMAELKKDDGSKDAIKNSTQAAISVGSNLHEQDLKD